MANIAAKKGASLKMARDVQRKKIKFSAPKSLLSPKNVYSKYSGVDDKTVGKRVCLCLSGPCHGIIYPVFVKQICLCPLSAV